MSIALIPLVLILVSVVISLVESQRKMLDYRLAALQRQLNKIAAHLNVDIREEVSPGVMEEIKAGRKIAAIKAYRMKTGAGLAEAKKAVENLAAEAGLHI